MADRCDYPEGLDSASLEIIGRCLTLFNEELDNELDALQPPFSVRLQALAAEADALLSDAFDAGAPRNVCRQIHLVQRAAHEAAAEVRMIEAGHE